MCDTSTEVASRHVNRRSTRAPSCCVCAPTRSLYPGKRYVDWELADPAGKSLDDVRAIRDEIDGRVQALLAELVRARVG